MLSASEDLRQTATVVPSPPLFPAGPTQAPQPSSKDSLRRAVLQARTAYVATLSDASRARLEARVARRLTALCAKATVIGGYSAIGSEISAALAMEEARSVGTIVAFPAFDDPAKPFAFRAGDPSQPGPFGILQPPKNAPKVDPDLILVPLIAIDSRGTRIGRGKGHYDRALARLRKNGATLVGIGWDLQRLEHSIEADDWDVALDGFASPQRLEWFR